MTKCRNKSIYCLFLKALTVSVEIAVVFQSDSAPNSRVLMTLILTHKGSSFVLHNSPAFFDLNNNGHYSCIVFVVENIGNIFSLVYDHVRIGILQQIIHFVEFTWVKEQKNVGSVLICP